VCWEIGEDDLPSTPPHVNAAAGSLSDPGAPSGPSGPYSAPSPAAPVRPHLTTNDDPLDDVQGPPTPTYRLQLVEAGDDLSRCRGRGRT
jgi:hypothetical protein